jgi:DNA-nicking Smr family endonuclease
MRSTGKPGCRRQGSRDISEDEAELWSTAMRATQRLTAKPRVVGSVLAANQPARQTTAAGAITPPRRAQDPGRAQSKAPAPPVIGKNGPQLAKFDRRRVRKIASGQVEIDGSIDLHGRREREAYSALRSFLIEAHGRGWRTVLVITGKGRGLASANAQTDHRVIGDRGIIRRSVPRWLEESQFRLVVLSYTIAHPRHGGDGAFYVQLRKSPFAT